ncbi:helix-turn-helix domain-containing protein [Micromonospora echinofusca]|uniref:helix-turn-helix domain-containing protein n=1 Tax=Micromonospora echinofusca TaxID=47858 RepID=UPI0037A15161
MTHANCPRCGGRLARDNDSGRCAPCQAAERDRLSAPPVVPASFWEHGPVRRALAERHLGRVVRAYRFHPYHGRTALPQTVVAGWLGITQAQLSRVENGPPLVHLDRLTHWAQVLRIPPRFLWFSLPARLTKVAEYDAAPVKEAGPTERPARTDATLAASNQGGGTTDRRQFHALAALAGIAATGSLDLLAAPHNTARGISMEQVRAVSSLVDEFRRTDAAVGANQLCGLAIRVHAQLSDWAAKATYSREVGEALQATLADLAIETAWLTIDANRRPEARAYLNEAITRARYTDDPRMEVRAFAYLALLTREDRPGESLHAVEAALRSSAGWGTPRLATLLHLRAARTYATLNDMSGFHRAMSRAQREFERGASEDDMPFLHFVTAQEVKGIEGLAYLALGQPERAADSFRAITENPSPVLRRNQIYYSVQLAIAAYRQGNHAEAAYTAMNLLPDVGRVNSGRVSLQLAQLRSHLGQPQRQSAATRKFVEAYDQAVHA